MNAHSPDSVLFHYDLGKNQFSGASRYISIAAGIAYIIIGLYHAYAKIALEQFTNTWWITIVLELMNGTLLILFVTGVFARPNRQYLKVTTTTVSYRISNAQNMLLPIQTIRHIGLYTSYITFDTEDGLRYTLDFPMLPCATVQGFQAALSELGLVITDFRGAKLASLGSK